MKNLPLVSARSARIGLPLVALVVVAGCVLKPKPGGPPPPPPFEYPALTTPESTLINVKYAWERRDSTRTKLIYRDDYQGASTDQTDGTGITLTYTKDQEVAVVWAMGQRSQIVANSVSMDLKPATWIRLRYPADPPGVAAIQMTGVNIQVVDTQYGTQVANSSYFFEFKFWPTVDSKSPTDTTWQVYRWTEIRQ